MKYLLLFLTGILINTVLGQDEHLDSMFHDIKVSTHQYHPLKDIELEFDYYEDNNATEELPLVIFVHGGGFTSGTHNNPTISKFAKRLASKGYAVASVSYRLTMKNVGIGCNITPEEKVEAINHASYDVMMATKHILNYPSLFKIRKDKVILIGSSAGAETVLNLAYIFDYQKNIMNFQYAGVISLAGSLTNLESISTDNAIPTQLFHGTGDPLIPYETGAHHYCGQKEVGFLMMYGSAPISQRLKGLGVSYYLYKINGGSHSWAGHPLARAFNEIYDFLYNDVVHPKSIRQTERTISDY